MIPQTPSQRSAALDFDRDVFSSGQVGSKLWLCEKLEAQWNLRGLSVRPARIWIYGGWQGLLGFLLLSRAQFPIEHIRSFDLDSRSTDRANALNENWVWRSWQFRAFTADVSDLQPSQDGEFGPTPHLILNTSVEHFPSQLNSQGEESASWWTNIPSGYALALQASDHEHQPGTSHQQASGVASRDEFARRFPLRELWWEGEIEFTYDTWTLKRLMRLGRK